MRVSILCLSLLFATVLSAQTDSVFQSSIAPTFTSIHTLTRSQIERLPAVNFLELVQGAFSFMANESQFEEEYFFIVNGFVLVNPNAINISQIESISFFPAGTNLTGGSSFKKGTFVITARPEKNGLSLSTKSGLVLANNTFPGSDIRESNNGFYSFNDLAYSRKAKNWFVSNSFAFLKNKFPGFTRANVTSIIKTASEVRTFRLSNFGGYEFNPHWKVEGGLFLTYKPQSAKDSVDWLTLPVGTSVKSNNYSDKTVDFGGAHAAIVFSPLTPIKNQFSAEITKFREVEKTHQDGDFISSSYMYDYKFSGRYTIYSFSDYFSWQALTTSNLQCDLSLFARYSISKNSENMFLRSMNGGQTVNASGSTSRINSKSFMTTPLVNVRVKNFLFAQAGVSYDSYINSQFAKVESRKLLPQAGVKFELAPFMRKTVFSTIEVSANYSKYLSSFENFDRFEDAYRSGTFIALSPYTTTVYPNPQLNGYAPGEHWLGSLAVGTHNDRFVFKVQYRQNKKNSIGYSLYSYNGGATYVYQMVSYTGKAWCFELNSSIIEKEKKNWKLYTMIFRDNYSKKYPSSIVPIDMPLLDSGKAPWRGGLKTDATFNRFFLQASVLFSFNELSYDKNGNSANDVDRFNNNFLLVGYTIPLKKTRIKNLEINAQSRSLFYSHSYPLAKYVGIGAQLNF